MAERRPDALVVFAPSGKRGRFRVGTPLLTAARRLGVDVDSVCGGRGICGRCRVVLSEGEFAAYGVHSRTEHLSPFSDPERRHSQRRELKRGERLSCHARLEGDCVIDVPADSQVHHQVVRKPYQSRDMDVNPLVHLHFVEVPRPRLEDPSGDLERLLRALEREWELVDLTCAPSVLPGLQNGLREGQWCVSVAIREGREVIGVWPGFKERLLGVAIDVGSTSLAAHLCDLTSGEVLASAGVMNPQIRFGEDLMSRVSYLMLNEGGEDEMTRRVREAIDGLIRDLTLETGADPNDVLELTFVGNPIMHHLLLGISPVQLGTAPFALATDGAVSLPARELELSVHPSARAYVLPCIAGHVGADASGMLLAERPWEAESETLLVDIGTNAEIVLATPSRILAASSPTGPAFEAAHISCGERATRDAIERVRIDRDSLEPRFKVIGCDLWSDEPGFEEQLGPSGISGLCGTGIIEAIAELFLAGVIDADGRIDPTMTARSARIVANGRTHAYILHDGTPGVRIDQNDVREIQLAKAALYAGIRLLMDALGIDEVRRIRLAGAFGSNIDPRYAMVLGMIPNCEMARVSSAGNAAGTGAIVALVDGASRRDIEAQVRRVEKIETAVEGRFQDHFVQAMPIPHATDPFPELAKHGLVPRCEPDRSGSRGARRPTRSRNNPGEA